MVNRSNSPINFYLQKAREITKQEDREAVIDRSTRVVKILGYVAAGAVGVFFVGKVLRLAASGVSDAKYFINSFKK